MGGDKVGEAWFGLSTRDEDLRRGLADAERKIDQTGAKVDNSFRTRVGGAIGRVKEQFRALGPAIAAIGTAFVASKAVAYLGDAINAASDFNEIVSKSGAIFGSEAVPKLESWAETAATTFGQSKTQALDAAATFAIFGKSAGMAGDDLVGFSTNFTELASDLASFHNSSPEEAIMAIGAALRGESEPIRRFGVLLDDATLKQRAFRLGIIETTTTALTPQQRVLAAQAEILAQTGDAQGDFERTSGGLANQQRILEAQLKDVSVAIGEQLLPAMVELVTLVNNDVVPAIAAIPGVLNGAAESVARLLDQTTHTTDDVERVMKALGLSYMDARDLIQQANSDMGMSAEEFADKVEAGYNVLDLAVTASARNVKLRNKEIITSTQESADAIPQILANVPAGIANPYAAGADAAAGALGDIPEKAADKLLDNQFHLTDATTELLNFMKQALSPAEEIFAAQMFLASKEAAAGLASGNPLVVRKTQELIADAEATLRSFNAFQPGYQVGTSYAAGMDAAYGVVRTAAGGLAAATRGQIGIDSEPKDPSSPLRGITRWGGNLVDTIVDEMVRESASRRHDVELVAARLRPPLGAALAGAVRPQGGSLTASGVARVEVTVRDPDGGLARGGVSAYDVADMIERRLMASFDGMQKYLRHEAAF